MKHNEASLAILAPMVPEKIIGGMPEGRLEWHFSNWRRWMRKDSVTDGYPGKAAGCVGGGYSQTFDDMADASEVRVARIVDALVGSLVPAQRAAINHKYLYAVFNFPSGNYPEILCAARKQMALWLVNRGVY